MEREYLPIYYAIFNKKAAVVMYIYEDGAEAESIVHGLNKECGEDIYEVQAVQIVQAL